MNKFKEIQEEYNLMEVLMEMPLNKLQSLNQSFKDQYDQTEIALSRRLKEKKQ